MLVEGEVELGSRHLRVVVLSSFEDGQFPIGADREQVTSISSELELAQLHVLEAELVPEGVGRVHGEHLEDIGSRLGDEHILG